MSSEASFCDALYFADYVVTQNADRQILEKGGLAVLGDKIVAVGNREELLLAWQGKEVYELGKAVLMPGMINAHTHIAMSFLRGRADDKPLMAWLTEDIFPIEAGLTQEKVYLSSLFSCLELIASGTTSVFDMYPLASGVFQALDEAGLRGVLGESVMVYPTASFKTPEEALDIVRGHAEAWAGHPRLRGAVLPHAIYTTTPEYLGQCRDLAQELGWTFGMHLAETAFETQECLKNYGKRPVEYCESLGLLTPQSTFFHNVEVNDSDMELLAQGQVALVHNSASNMKLASGFAPIEKMRARGLSLALGTDGPASNNTQNLFRDMYLAALLQKGITGEATALPAQSALDMATLGGAKALHWEGLGSLEVGHLADFIALDLSGAHLQPLYNVVSHLVYAATGRETLLNVVGGKLLYYKGEFKTLDYTALCEEMESLKRWVLSH